MRALRLLTIIAVALRYGLDTFLRGRERTHLLVAALGGVLFWRDLSAPVSYTHLTLPTILRV